jgi:cytochrome P450 family 110
MSALPAGSGEPSLVQTARFIGRPRAYLTALRARHGDVFTMRSLNGTVVMGCTPEHAKQLFTAEPSTFRTFATEALGPMLGEGSMLVVYGEPHRKQRKLMQPSFHGERMREYGAAMRDVTLRTLQPLKRGDEARAHSLTTVISLEVILRTVFGLDGDALEEGRRVLSRMLDGLSPLLLFTRRFQHPLFPPWRRFLAAQAEFTRFLERQVELRRRSGAHGEDILGMLLDAHWEDGERLSILEIRDHLLTLLVAGHETTAISLAWAVHDVYRDAAVLRRLRDEIDTLGPDPEMDALAKLPYLGAVCDETLRLRPIITDVLRTLVAPFEYGGHPLPVGVTASVAIELIHSDPTIYAEPEQFRPERFLERRFSPFEFLPFGGGHRRCLGAAFSNYEARIVLATLVARYDIEPLALDTRVRRNVTMGPKNGVPIRITGLR